LLASIKAGARADALAARDETAETSRDLSHSQAHYRHGPLLAPAGGARLYRPRYGAHPRAGPLRRRGAGRGPAFSTSYELRAARQARDRPGPIRQRLEDRHPGPGEQVRRCARAADGPEVVAPGGAIAGVIESHRARDARETVGHLDERLLQGGDIVRPSG